VISKEQLDAIESHAGGVNRLRTWVREFGDTVMSIFRDDVKETLKAVDCLIETIRELQAENAALKDRLARTSDRLPPMQAGDFTSTGDV